MDLVVHLFEIEHYQVGYFQQFINHRIVTTNKTVGVQTGMNAFFFAGAEPVTNKLSLQDCFTAGCGNAAAGSVHKVAIGHHFLHQIFNGNFFTAMRVPGVAVMTIQAAHQAALEKGDKANTRAVYGSTGFKGVNATNN